MDAAHDTARAAIPSDPTAVVLHDLDVPQSDFGDVVLC
jgi:hypothetical protein